MQDLYAYVGSLEQMNPRHYRLLVGTVPRPLELSRQTPHLTLSDAGFGPLTPIIAENVQVSVRKSLMRAVVLQIATFI